MSSNKKRIIKHVLVELFQVLALIWLLLSIGMMFCIEEYPVTAITMNLVSIIGIAVANALNNGDKRDA